MNKLLMMIIVLVLVITPAALFIVDNQDVTSINAHKPDRHERINNDRFVWTNMQW